MIISHFYPDVGGTERSCQRTAQALKEKGFDVTVLTTYKEDLPAREVIDGIPVYRYIKGWHVFELTYMVSVLSFLIRHRQHIDGILCYGLYLFTAPAVLFCRVMGKRVFFRLSSARQTGDFHRIAQLACARIIQWCAKRAHGAIAITREIEQELLQHGFSSKKIVRISNAVDTTLFVPGQLRAENPFIICYVGRLVDGKGLETFLLALKTLLSYSQSFKAVIAGDGALKTSMLRSVEQYGLSDVVSFIGATDTVLPYYQRSHAFVLPSYSEGMPLSLIEAMACGVCPVATPVGGIVDVINVPYGQVHARSGYQIYTNGILCTPGDYPALAHALLELMRDRVLWQHLCVNAVATVKKEYNQHTVIQQYRALFKGTSPI